MAPSGRSRGLTGGRAMDLIRILDRRSGRGTRRLYTTSEHPWQGKPTRTITVWPCTRVEDGRNRVQGTLGWILAQFDSGSYIQGAKVVQVSIFCEGNEEADKERSKG